MISWFIHWTCFTPERAGAHTDSEPTLNEVAWTAVGKNEKVRNIPVSRQRLWHSVTVRVKGCKD